MTHAGTQAFAFLSKKLRLGKISKIWTNDGGVIGTVEIRVRLFVSDDFERDMRAAATRLESLPLTQSNGWFRKLRENGFVPPLAAA